MKLPPDWSPPKMNKSSPARHAALGWMALAAAPLFFSTNIIFGRAAIALDPFTLAALRWALASAALFLIIRPQWHSARQLIVEHWRLMLFCGFLAMWVCGALVYLALKYTTATNGTLIYTTPPLIIIILERFTRGRKIKFREIIGIAGAVLGIMLIITKGNLQEIVQMQFNKGDLLFVLAAVSWAIYTLALRTKQLAAYSTRVVFAVTAAFGTLTILPFAIVELFRSGAYPVTAGDWQMVAGIVIFSSLVPFSLYQFGNRLHGATSASVFMYLLPPFGLGLAWLFLDEIPNLVTLSGCLLVLGGVIVATLPADFLRRKND